MNKVTNNRCEDVKNENLYKLFYTIKQNLLEVTVFTI